jgi:hypothetical protein
MYTESEKPRKFFSSIWVQAAIALAVVGVIMFSALAYLNRYLSTSEWDFYLQVLPPLSIFVVMTVVVFLKEHRDRRSAK